MKEKKRLSPTGLRLIIFTALLHFFGATVTLWVGGKAVSEFNLFFHLLRFFSGWSVHTSILTIWVAILIWRERKKPTSYLTQFLTFLATLYNLITFFFGIYCLFFLSVEWGESGFLNIQSVLWHVAAPLGTLVYFYFYARVAQLKRKLFKTLSLAFISPVIYFFYVGTLAKLNVGKSSSLFPYMEKYPYSIFESIAEREGKLFVVNFLAACLVFLSLAGLIIGTKSVYEKWKNKKS